MTMHVILGGNGVVGRETIAALRAGGHAVTAVSRTPSADPRCRTSPQTCGTRHPLLAPCRVPASPT